MFEIVCKKVFVWDWRYLVEGFRRLAALSQSYKRPVGVLLRRILGSSPNQCVNSQPSPSGHHPQPPLVLGYPGEAARPRLERLPRRPVVALPRVFWSSVILTGNQTVLGLNIRFGVLGDFAFRLCLLVHTFSQFAWHKTNPFSLCRSFSCTERIVLG